MTQEFVELAELEFILPPAPAKTLWKARRIFGSASPDARDDDPMPRSNRAFVMSLKGDGYSYFVDLLPGLWSLRLQMPSGAMTTIEMTCKAGEKRGFLVLADSSLNELSLEETSVSSDSSIFERRSKERRNQIEQRGWQIGSILNTLSKYDGQGPARNDNYSSDELDTKVMQYTSEARPSGLIPDEIVGMRAHLTQRISATNEGMMLWQALNSYILGGREGDLRLLPKVQDTDIWASKSDREIAQVGLPGRRPSQDPRSWVDVNLNQQRLLLSAPPEWNSVNRSGYIPYSVHLKTRNTPVPLARIYVHDPNMYDVMYAMTPTGIADAEAIVEMAESWLLEKVNNPVAAVGGGFTLLAHKLHGEERSRWFGWLRNLDNWNPWLPDAAILRGTLLLKGPRTVRDFDAARDHFKRAFRTGIPYYTLGISWLQTGLGKLAGDDPELQDMFNEVSMLARRLDTSAVFTSLRL